MKIKFYVKNEKQIKTYRKRDERIFERKEKIFYRRKDEREWVRKGNTINAPKGEVEQEKVK